MKNKTKTLILAALTLIALTALAPTPKAGCTTANQHGRITTTIPTGETTAKLEIPISQPCNPHTTLATGSAQHTIPIIINADQALPLNLLQISVTLLNPEPGPTEITIGWAILQ